MFRGEQNIAPTVDEQYGLERPILTMSFVVRSGVASISVTFQVTQRWLTQLTAYKQQEKISVDYLDPETAEMRNTEMYVDGFKVKLENDTSYKGLWTVSFTLKEL